MRARLITIVLLASAIAMGAPDHVCAQTPLPLTWSDIGSSEPGTTGRAAIDEAIRGRQWAVAEQLLAKAIEQTPGDTGLLATFATICLVDRKPLNAAVAIKKAEALGSISDDMRFALAIAYISLQHGDWARPELERLASSNSSNPSNRSQATYQYWLGRLDYDDGEYASAIGRFEDVVRREPRFVRAYDNLGLCYEAQNQPEKAIANYREAVRLNRLAAQGNRSAWPPLNFGVLLRHRGELVEAEGLLKESISYQPGLAQAYYELGMLLEQRQRTSEAITELAGAVKADPTYPEPHYALSRIYRREGRVDQADEAMATFRRLRTARDRREQPNETP
jgi:tetratricopeptide (TPR) repeat protein